MEVKTDGNIRIGDVFRIIGKGDFLDTSGIGQLVRVDKMYNDDKSTYFVQFRYRNSNGDLVTCITSTEPQFVLVRYTRYLTHSLRLTTANVDVEPIVETRLSGRKIWYRFDASHVTPMPAGPFPMMPGPEYGGRHFFGRWVSVNNKDTIQTAFGLALPFHLKAPGGFGVEEHGPPVITLGEIIMLYNKLKNPRSVSYSTSLWGRPKVYTILGEVSESDIGMLMESLGVDPTDVIPVIAAEYQRRKDNVNLVI